MASPHEQDAHTRHGGTAWRPESAGETGVVNAAGIAGCMSLTLAIRPWPQARNPQGSGGDWRVRSSRLMQQG